MESINMQKESNQVLQVLKDGGLILYPTDTIWGIGCDATNEDAVAKIFELKQRNESKALISLVENKKQLITLTDQIPKEAESHKPTTIIYTNISGLAKNLIANDGTVAIRIVQDHFCKQLIQNFGKPIVSTSANISGENTPNQFSEISDEIKNNVDYIVNLQLNKIMTTPSEILLINDDGSIKIIR
jgi:L-threonylcarbamoyladenylate synthase